MGLMVQDFTACGQCESYQLQGYVISTLHLSVLHNLQLCLVSFVVLCLMMAMWIETCYEQERNIKNHTYFYIFMRLFYATSSIFAETFIQYLEHNYMIKIPQKTSYNRLS